MDVKQTVLSVLQNPGTADGFVSGQELAERCGVTRTSVWKAIESLRKQGAQIQAVTNRGYALVKDSIFCKESIVSLLPPDSDIKAVFFDSTDSTNTQAKLALAAQGGAQVHKTAFVAASQTAGRGRMGRNFFSPEKTGVYLSLVYSGLNFASPSVVTASAAVAVCRAVKQVYGIDPSIKWINDIFFEGKKICGILTEGVTNFETGVIESVIVGIGVNIAQSDLLPTELKGIAGSVLSDSNAEKRSELCAAIICELTSILDGTAVGFAAVMAEYKARSFLIGKTVTVSPVINQTEQNYECTVIDITDDAKLVVRLADGSQKQLESGEVSVKSAQFCN